MSEPKPQASRRRFFAGAATVGAAAAAATVLPGLPASAPALAEAMPPAPERGGGYWVSEHVKRYYQSTQL